MQVEKLYHHCFMGDDLREGDLYPVGGSIIGSPESPWKVRVDFETFYPEFNDVAQHHVNALKEDAWQGWFKKQCTDVDPKLLTLLQGFTSAFEAKRKIQSSNRFERNTTYEAAAEHAPALSEVYDKNHAMCVEISLLAKKFLDSHGVKSKLFSGEAIFNYDQSGINIPEPHTFLLIERDGQELIFDPANPTFSGDGRPVFTLLKPCSSISEQIEKLKADCLMIEAKNLVTHSSQYYGVGDCGNVPEQFIIHANARADGQSWAAASADRTGRHLS